MNKIRKKTEHEEQVALCNYLRRRELSFFSVPNGMWSRGGYGMIRKLQTEGMTDGIPDLIVLPNIAIEMKKDLGLRHKLPCNCMSDDQKKWEGIFKQHNWHHILAHGADDAIDKIKQII